MSDGTRRRERIAVLAGFLDMVLQAGLRSSFAVFLPFLVEDIGGRLSVLAAAFTVHMLTYTAVSPFVAGLFERYRAHHLMRVGGSLTTAGLLVFAVAPNPGLVVLGYGVIIGCSTHGYGAVAANRPLVAMRPNRRDRAIGNITVGVMVGSAVMPAFVAILGSMVGWRWAAVALGALVFATTWWLSWLTARNDITPATAERCDTAASRANGPPPEGRKGSPRSDATEKTRTWRDRTFLTVSGGVLLGVGIQASVPLFIPLWALALGFGAGTVAVGMLVYGAAGAVSRVVFASVAGRFPLRLWIVLPSGAVTAVGLVVATTAAGMAGFIAGVVLLGFGTSVYGPVFTLSAMTCFPLARFTRVLGALIVPSGIGGGLIPAALTVPYERGLGLGLVWSIVGLATAAAAALLLVAELRSPVGRANRAPPALATP